MDRREYEKIRDRFDHMDELEKHWMAEELARGSQFCDGEGKEMYSSYLNSETYRLASSWENFEISPYTLDRWCFEKWDYVQLSSGRHKMWQLFLEVTKTKQQQVKIFDLWFISSSHGGGITYLSLKIRKLKNLKRRESMRSTVNRNMLGNLQKSWVSPKRIKQTMHNMSKILGRGDEQFGKEVFLTWVWLEKQQNALMNAF